MNNKEVFFSGLVIGAAVLALAIYFTGNSANQLDNKWKKEIISKGYGEWFVSTNKSDPEVEFRWK